jgi:hypothetical protein
VDGGRRNPRDRWQGRRYSGRQKDPERREEKGMVGEKWITEKVT